MSKFKKFLSLLACAPLFLGGCIMNNGLCTCEEPKDLNFDGLCDTCGHPIEGMCVHQDKNGDHICDICGEEIIDPEVGPADHRTIVSLGAVTAPEKILVGATLLPSQVSVVINYDDGTTDSVHPTEVSLDTSEASPSITGTVTYEGKTAEFSIEVYQEAPQDTIISISNVSAPAHITQDGTLELTDVTLVAHFADGSSQTVNPESISLDTSTVGPTQGSVSYKGMSSTFDIIVDEKEAPVKTIVSLGAVTSPEKIAQNTNLTVNDVTVVVNYSDDSSETVNPEMVSLSTSSIGTATGIVVYGGKYTTFEILVVGISQLLVETCPVTIVQNNALSVNDVTLKVIYSDTTFEMVHPESIELDTSTLGLVNGTLTYKGHEKWFSITVVAPAPEPDTIVSLTNINAPAQILKDATLSVNDVTFTVNYYSGTSTNNVHPESITLNTSSVGVATGTVHYQGFSANFTITVYEESAPVVLTGIVSVSAPASINEFGVLDPNDVTLYLAYSDNSSGTAHPESIDLDTTVTGEVTGTVHYQGFSKTFKINVKGIEQVTVYLVLTSVGLYNGERGNPIEELYLENTIAYVGVPGSPLPGKDVVTHSYGNCDFESWLSYEGDGFPTVYTTVPYENNKILYANFVENGSDPVDPGDPVDPSDPITPGATETYYLVTSFPDNSGDWDQWDTENNRGAQKIFAWVWNANESKAYEMNWDSGRTWKVDIPQNKYNHILFTRTDPTITFFSWDSVYNQTTDLDFVAGKHTAQVQSWGAGYNSQCPVVWVS